MSSYQFSTAVLTEVPVKRKSTTITMKLLAFLFVVIAALAFADAYPGAPLWAPAVAAVPTVVKTIQPAVSTVVKTIQPAVVAPAPVLIGKPLLANGWAGNGWAGNGWAGNGWAGNAWGGKAILG